jgi:hypothetical protein
LQGLITFLARKIISKISNIPTTHAFLKKQNLKSLCFPLNFKIPQAQSRSNY